MKDVSLERAIQKIACKRFNLQLSVGDKFILNNFFPIYMKRLNTEMGLVLPVLLIDFGYDSKKLREHPYYKWKNRDR